MDHEERNSIYIPELQMTWGSAWSALRKSWQGFYAARRTGDSWRIEMLLDMLHRQYALSLRPPFYTDDRAFFWGTGIIVRAAVGACSGHASLRGVKEIFAHRTGASHNGMLDSFFCTGIKQLKGRYGKREILNEAKNGAGPIELEETRPVASLTRRNTARNLIAIQIRRADIPRSRSIARILRLRCQKRSRDSCQRESKALRLGC
jgi:hypothetical protein